VLSALSESLFGPTIHPEEKPKRICDTKVILSAQGVVAYQMGLSSMGYQLLLIGSIGIAQWVALWIAQWVAQWDALRISQ